MLYLIVEKGYKKRILTQGNRGYTGYSE